MIKEIDPMRPYLTWYTDNGIRCKNIKEKVVSVESQFGMWAVEWWDYYAKVGYEWVKFGTYPTREEAEAVAEMVFLTQPWR